MGMHSKSCRGTTLVEMLVIVSIIGVLLTIIVPSMSAGRSLAKRAVCMTNLHALGAVTKLYCENHNGHFPPLFYYFEPGASDTIVILVVPKKAAVAGWTNYDPAGWVCPSDSSPKKVSVRQLDNSIVTYSVSYGYNVDLLLRDMTVDELLPNPSNIVLFFDGMEDGTGKRQGHYDCSFDYVNDATAFRHLGYACAVYVDGHVEMTKQIRIDEIISGQDPIGTGHGVHGEPDERRVTPDTSGRRRGPP
ncbi:MAG: hypothetical protein HZA50_10420 [Planctomycetes bacterium]|nr:hypothetical protein [Planctomycetota bacterium]